MKLNTYNIEFKHSNLEIMYNIYIIYDYSSVSPFKYQSLKFMGGVM